MTADINKLRALLEELPAYQLEELRRDVAEMTFKKRKEGEIPSAREGAPVDTAVQRAAAHALKMWRLKEGLSFGQIGEILGVSDERVRRLYERLCPFEYESEKRSRRAAG